MIFVSTNAVDYAYPLLPDQLPADVGIAAIGQATAQALDRVGLTPTLVPERMDSEGLLALPGLQDIQGRRVLILRGNGGRELLAEDRVAALAAEVTAERPITIPYETLRAVLDTVPEGARVTVVEIFPAVVSWNRGELAHLAREPLADDRVWVEEADVAAVIAANPRTFDAVLLDVDNGPAAFTVARNERLYGAAGLAAIRRGLRPRGVLGVWSADPDPPFEKRLKKAGFRVTTEMVRARGHKKGPKHTIFIAEMK